MFCPYAGGAIKIIEGDLLQREGTMNADKCKYQSHPLYLLLIIKKRQVGAGFYPTCWLMCNLGMILRGEKGTQHVSECNCSGRYLRSCAAITSYQYRRLFLIRIFLD